MECKDCRGLVPHGNRATGAVRTACGGMVICLLVLPGAVRAGGGPENVAVVVNADSWASQTVANHYVHWRQIPASNVVVLEGLNEFEQTDVDTFRDKILVPVMKALFERDLLDQIDYIVYSSDFPTAINVQKDLGGAKPPKVQTPTASITGLTYLYQLVLQKDPRYLGLLTNFYARRPLRDLQSVLLTERDREALQQVEAFVGAGKWDEAAPLLQRLAEQMPNNAGLHYNLACCLAKIGQPEAAFRALERAVTAGWADAKQAREDPDLEVLRNSPAFDTLLQTMGEKRNEFIEIQPTTAFRSTYLWNQLGARVSSDGVRYMLSTMLAVTSGRGNSVREALQYLERSVAADATNPRGTVYFMENSDVRSTTRQWAFASAVKSLEGTAVQGAIASGALPQKQSDVAGVMAGAASVKWAASGSTLLPGAIGEHLTSYGGIMREGVGQTPLSEFLRYGAAGSSGTVAEPYAVQAKFPAAFLHVHYARGCSLAESFYQSLFGPYQLLIVGDALCQPWIQPYSLQVGGVEAGAQVSGDVVLDPRVEAAAGNTAEMDHVEVFIDGRRLLTDAGLRRLAVDTTALGDGWHELRVVAVRADPIETQSRVVIPLLVNNRGGAVTLEVVPPGTQTVTYGEPLVVHASAPLARSIAILHQGRTLDTIAGPEGTVQIDTRRLGLGPVTVQATARLHARTSYSAPVMVNILPPTALPPLKDVTAGQLVDGMQVAFDKDVPVIVTDTIDAKWLSNLQSGVSRQLTLTGYFEAGETDVYQFQFTGNSVSRIRVGDQAIWEQASAAGGPVAWTMVPVHLERGMHRLELTGVTARTPSLRIRFGGPGCTSLDGKRFRHIP